MGTGGAENAQQNVRGAVCDSALLRECLRGLHIDGDSWNGSHVLKGTEWSLQQSQCSHGADLGDHLRPGQRDLCAGCLLGSPVEPFAV